MEGSEGGVGGRASPFCAGATQKEGIAGEPSANSLQTGYQVVQITAPGKQGC